MTTLDIKETSAALLLLLVFACNRESGLITASSVQRLRPDQAPVQISLQRGRLQVSTKTGDNLLTTGPDEYVIGYASGNFLQTGDDKELLVWSARRDQNVAGVVPHHSGWMSYGDNPWINMHLSIYAQEENMLNARWISSALDDPIEALWLEESTTNDRRTSVWLRQRGKQGPCVTRYRFRGWQLEMNKRFQKREFPPGLSDQETGTRMIDLIMAGDVMLGREVGRRLSRSGYERAFSSIRDILADADIAIGNLESCFSSKDSWSRPPLDLTAPAEHVAALPFLGFDVLNLANNHCSMSSSRFSQNALAAVGISAVGTTPKDVDRNPLFVHKNGLCIGLIGGMVWPTSLDEIDKLQRSDLAASLKEAAARSDLLVATIHWGEEYSKKPSAAQKRLAHWLIDQGVDVIAGHHPHVVQPVEVYKRGLIAYSLGNFVFDQEGYVIDAQGGTERGLLLRVRFHKDLGLTFQEIPICIADRHRVHRCVDREPPPPFSQPR